MIPDTNVVTKSPFVVGDRVCLEAIVTVPELLHLREQRYIIVPCVTPQRTSARLRVTVFLSTPKFSIEELPLLPRRQVAAEWRSSAPFLKYFCAPSSTSEEEGTAGGDKVGDRLAAASVAALSANPQVEFCPHDADPHFIINMEVSGVVDPLIAFAVVANDDFVGVPLLLPADQQQSSPSPSDAADPQQQQLFASLPEGKVIAKSRYIRHTSVTAELTLPRGVRAQSYIIVPYLQPAGSSGSCVVTVSNTSPGFAVRTLTGI